MGKVGSLIAWFLRFWRNQAFGVQPTDKLPLFPMNGNGKVNTEKVIRTIEALENNEEWHLYVETLAEVLNELIDDVRKEIGKPTNTASLRYTGVIPNIKEKVQFFSKISFIDGEIVELLRVINHFLKPYALQIHPIGSKGLFVSRIENGRGTLVDELEKRFREKLQK